MRKIVIFLLVFGIQTAFSQNNKTEKIFTHKKVNAATAVKNQNHSGTCWSFAAISFLESELLRLYDTTYDLSEMYVVHNILIEKAIMHNRMQTFNYYTPGGQPHDVINAIKKYGIAPEQVYTGRNKGEARHNHDLMDSLCVDYLAKFKGENVLLPQNWLEPYNLFLDEHLGKLPEKFEYSGKTYTPDEFAKSLKLNLDDYIEITSYSHHPYYEPFVMEDKFNWSLASYHNIPLDEFMEVIDNAINTGYTVCWNGDVSENGFLFTRGTATVPEDNKPDAETRQKMFDNHESTIDHVMHITGIAYDENNKKFYYTKNSWGERNIYNGYLFLSEPFVVLKTISILVHKDAIPTSIRKKMKL